MTEALKQFLVSVPDFYMSSQMPPYKRPEDVLRAFVGEVERRGSDKAKPFRLDYPLIGLAFEELVREFGLDGEGENET